MSRCYEIKIDISGHDQTKRDGIEQALRDLDYEEEVEIIDMDEPEEVIQCRPDVINIPGSISSESAVAKEVTHAVWKANGKFCKVVVVLRDLDESPPTYEMDEKSFAEWESNKT